MKLTSADLDTAIASGAPLRPMLCVRARNGRDEMLILSIEAAPHELPPLALPEATEPFSIGSTFAHPAPQRDMWQDERDNRWLIPLYAVVTLLVVVACAVLERLRMNAIATETGLRAWFARRWELLCVNATLAAGEADREALVRELAALPTKLHQLDRDLALLRVRQALLRGGN